MPLAPNQKEWLIRKHGLDPAQFDFDETSGQFVERTPEVTASSPSVGPQDLVPAQAPVSDDKPLTTFGKSFLDAVPSTVAGAGGAIGGMELGAGLGALGGPLAPVTVPLGGLLGAGAGAFGASKLGRYIQNKLMPDSWMEDVAASAKQNPKSAMAGSLATIPLAGGMNPNIPNVIKAGGAAVDLGANILGRIAGQTTRSLRPDQVSNLMNVAGGAGIGAGMGAIENKLEGKDVDLKALAENAALGAVFNKPNVIGRRVYGFHDVIGTPEEQAGWPGKRDVVRELPARSREVAAPEESVQWKRNIPEAGQEEGVGQPDARVAQDEQNIAMLQAAFKEADVAKKLQERKQAELQDEYNKNLAEQLRLKTEYEQRRQQVQEDWNAAAEAKKHDEMAAAYEAENQRIAKENAKLRAQLDEMQRADELQRRGVLSDNSIRILNTEKLFPSDVSRTEQQAKYKVPRKTFKEIPAEESAKDLEMRRMEAELSGEERPRYQEESTTKQDETTIPQRNWNTKAARAGREMRGVETKFLPEQPVAGSINTGQRKATIDTSGKAGLDTTLHEYTHQLFADMIRSPRAGDRKFVKRYQAVVEATPEFRKYNKETSKDWEEFVTERGGIEATNRLLGKVNESGFRRWSEDLKSYAKTRFEKYGTPEDYRRVMEHKLLFEKSDKGTGRNVSAGAGEVKRQQEQSDYDLYTDLKKQLTEIPNTLENWEKKTAVQRKIEEVKNRNGGKPPVKQQEESSLGDFYLTSERKLREEFKGREDVKLPASQIAGRLKNTIPPTEWEMIKDIVPTEKRYSPREIVQMLRENGPRVEVRKFGEGSVPDWVNRYNQLSHEVFDSKTQEGKYDLNAVVRGQLPLDELIYNKWGFARGENVAEVAKLKEYIELAQRAAKEDIRSNAAHWSSIAPKHEKDMPGYVEVAVVKPTKTAASFEEFAKRNGFDDTPRSRSIYEREVREGKLADYNRPQFPSSHSFPPNTLGFGRGYMETLPNGKKVFHVIEVQSDWAQQQRRYRQEIQERGGPTHDRHYNIEKTDDPLLPHYERLVLKSLIKHAREQGADAIALSDAKSAMMTEGHDRVAIHDIRRDNRQIGAEDYLEKRYGGGMRLHYDQTMPKILEELTGVKSEEIDFGPHKHALDVQTREPRKDLIFRNPDGTPKTSATARMYDLNKTPERFSLTERRQQERSSFANILTSRFDKIRERLPDLPEAAKATEHLHKFAGEKDYLAGKFANPILEAVHSSGLTPEEIQRVYKHQFDVDANSRSDIELSAPEQSLADYITSQLREPKQMQRDLGLRVKAGKGFREAGMKPEGYMHNMLSPKVAHEWAENPGSALSRQYEEAYLAHQERNGVSPTEAREMLNQYKLALGNERQTDAEFGAIRKAEGNGLPWDLVEQNFAAATVRYAKRAARDLAFYKHLQSDPELRKALNIPDYAGKFMRSDELSHIQPISTEDAVQKAMRSVWGDDQIPENPKMLAVARVVNNALMGVGTAARNIASMPAFMASYVQAKQLPLAAKALANISEVRSRAFEANSIKSNFLDYDAAGFHENSPDPVVNLLNKFSGFLRKYQGRDFSDNFEGAYYHALGELLAVNNITEARTTNGKNKESIRFLQRFGDIVDGGPERLIDPNGTPATDEDVQRIAKRFVDGIRGTYGPEGLPSFAIEGGLAPFTALSRFSLEKANTIWKDVIEPARQGVYGPLLRYTLASMGVGLGIEQLNELLSNKRGNEPKVSEILTEGNQKDLVAKAISTLQLASFAGTVGDVAGMVSGAAQHKSTKFNQPLSFPLYTFLTETIASNLTDAVAALQDGEDPFETMGRLAGVIGSQSLQTMRYVNNNILNPEDTKRKERFRDKRVFDELTDSAEPQDQTGRVNEMTKAGARKFKRTDDIAGAVEQLPALINAAFERSNGNIDRLKKELQQLKANSYQTMPSPERMPSSFIRYLNFLSTTQGPEAAAERLQDYVKQNAVNKAKSELVPSL